MKKAPETSSILLKSLPLFVFIAILAAWEFLAGFGRISPLFFPAPSKIFLHFLHMLSDGTLAAHLGATLSRVFVGLALGTLPALLIGLAMGWSRKVRAFADPFVAATHPIPKIAVLPLIMIVFGIGEASKVVVIAVAAFFPMLINTMAGVRQISPIHFEVARCYGAGLYKLFTRIVLPGSFPMIVTGLRLALNMAFLLAVAAELLTAKEGLGAMIWLAWQTLRTEDLYVSLAMTSALGVCFNFSLQRLARFLIPWQEERAA